MTNPLTHVELIWIARKIERWIRFGVIVEDKILDRQHRIVSFAPNSIFAFVRWAANDYGTIVSRLDILKAVSPGQAYSAIPGVSPGGEMLLRVSGWPKVEQVFRLIDKIETQDIDPTMVSPDYWRQVHNRIKGREMPRVYTLSQHKAWLMRKAAS